MRALTLRQYPLPYASLVAWELKKYETRSLHYWTEYRGLIAIHAAKTKQRTSATQLTQFVEPKSKEWKAIHCVGSQSLLETLPYGCITCVAKLTDCIIMTSEIIEQQSQLELATGLWEVGRVGLRMENVCKLSKPLPIERGWQSWGQTSKEMDAEIFQLVDNLAF